MDFKLNDEQLEFQEHCRRFAREVIRPVAAKHDREESVPWEVIKAAREWNLHGLETIQRMGTDPDGLFSCIYAEELHWGCAGIALAIQGGSLAAAGRITSRAKRRQCSWNSSCSSLSLKSTVRASGPPLTDESIIGYPTGFRSTPRGFRFVRG